MENTERLEGKVAQILNTRELVINLGEKDGVEEGMYFRVLDPTGEDIEDPDSGEVIGSLRRTKVRVKVIDVKEKLSVAQTYETERVNIGGTGSDFGLGDFSRSLMPPKWVKKHETLKTNEETWEDIDEEESYVKTGDPVEQLFEEEIG